DWKTPTEIIHYLVRAAGVNANLLLNVGPTPEGEFQPEVVETLKAVGEWTRRYGETIYATTNGPVPPQPWGVSTQKGNKESVHVLDGTVSGSLALPGRALLNVKKVSLFEDGREIPFRKDGDVVIELPAERDDVDTIVTLEL